MNQDELEKMVVDGLSSYDIATEVGKSQTTVRYWLNKYELATRRVYKCRNCGDVTPTSFFAGRFSECKKCRRKDQTKRLRKNKNLLVQYKGGKCIKCGYNKCLSALDFHHLNPLEKDPNWIKMKNWSPKRVEKEVDKCELVCRNCHAEIHEELKQSVA